MREPGAESPSPTPEPLTVVRASAVVGLGTALSRLTGFVRLAAIAYAIGFERLTDTYNLANTTPNIVYELLLGGILSATLVPVFVEHLERGDEDAPSAVASVAAAVLVALTVAGILAAPWIVRLYTLRAEGPTATAQQEVATALLRLFMPQMLFYGLTAIGTALLNARRAFAAPAFAPVLNNLVVSALFFALPTLADGDVDLARVRDDTGLLLFLGLGTTAGIAAMTVALWPSLRRTGLRLRWRPSWRHPAVRTVVRLSGWTVGYVASNQVALWVVLVLANAHPGGVAAYQGAFVFFQLPHGLFAVSLMTTLAPELASLASRGEWVRYRERFALGLRMVAMVVVPAAVGYALLARPIVAALLQRGAFGGAEAELTGDVLTTFALGLFPFSTYLFTLRGFYALKDTRTPFVLNAGENAANVVLAVALEPALGVPGLGLAYSLAYTLAAVAGLVVLSRRVGGLNLVSVAGSLARVLAACGVMAAVVAVASGAAGTDTGNGAVTRTVVGVLTGSLSYLAVLAGLRTPDLAALRERVTRRRPEPGAVTSPAQSASREGVDGSPGGH